MEKKCSDYKFEIDYKSILTDDIKRAKPCIHWNKDNVYKDLTKLNMYNFLIDSLNTTMEKEVDKLCKSCKFKIY
ncbi:unnamed protein product [Paramecium sonneborni]|uniref:Uncharacterized protein n=1 Tax=Paramecium sonneborni TaxID=65129 RepID=A0A8S1RRI0_9CILI|nr:unnamed protein product [Paramecium sonneborni]